MKIKGKISGHFVLAEDKEAKALYTQSRFGEQKQDKFQYSLVEAFYLLETKKMLIYKTGAKKSLTKTEFTNLAKKREKNFLIRYAVFKDLRSRGYIVKTALKFGADFRVYDRGIKPGQDHAKWIAYPIHESEVLTWYDFSAKNRVAHSTRKRLLICIVDEESDVSYWETSWIRP